LNAGISRAFVSIEKSSEAEKQIRKRCQYHRLIALFAFLWLNRGVRIVAFRRALRGENATCQELPRNLLCNKVPEVSLQQNTIARFLAVARLAQAHKRSILMP